MRLLVFGTTGQLARELALAAPHARFLGRAEADLSDPDACASAIRAYAGKIGPAGPADQPPIVVINAAAFTAVDRAETEEAAATRINAESPAAMTRVCAELGLPFLHVSTDYVFDGTGDQPFLPSDAPAPLGAYGRSKLAGEQGILAAGGTSVILRTSWVFSAHGANFVKTMLRLSAERAELSVVDDQIGGPTPARALAAALFQIAEIVPHRPDLGGIYHFAGAPDVSWAAFARAIMAEAGLPCQIQPIPSSQYPTPAKRPANSRLNCDSLARFDLQRPDWRAGLSQVLSDLGDL